MPRALIYCHARLWSDPTKHWQAPNIQATMEFLGHTGPTDFITGDIAPGGDLCADMFSCAFYEQHAGTFDAVFLLDAAGAWWREGSIETWASILTSVKKLLRPGGAILAGKFVSALPTAPKEESSINALAQHFRRSGEFTAAVPICGPAVHPCRPMAGVNVLLLACS